MYNTVPPPIFSHFGHLPNPNTLASSPLSLDNYQSGRMKASICFLWDTWIQPVHRAAEHTEESTNCLFLLTWVHRHPWLVNVDLNDRGESNAISLTERAWQVTLYWDSRIPHVGDMQVPRLCQLEKWLGCQKRTGRGLVEQTQGQTC